MRDDEIGQMTGMKSWYFLVVCLTVGVLLVFVCVLDCLHYIFRGYFCLSFVSLSVHSNLCKHTRTGTLSFKTLHCKYVNADAQTNQQPESIRFLRSFSPATLRSHVWKHAFRDCKLKNVWVWVCQSGKVWIFSYSKVWGLKTPGFMVSDISGLFGFFGLFIKKNFMWKCQRALHFS